MRISIHAAREGGDVLDFYEYLGATISIHAAREGGDGLDLRYAQNIIISIHAAREGGDHIHAGTGLYPRFQSTPPVKAATCLIFTSISARLFQSTPPVKAATLGVIIKPSKGKDFNPRRP